MSPISSHVLDTALGRPAENLRVRLEVFDEHGQPRLVAERTTNAHGRITDFLPAGALEARTYRLWFDTGSYLAATHQAAFFPYVEVVFRVTEPHGHYHVPLLLSPFGFSTYRGS